MWAVKQSPEVKLIALQEYIWCHHQHRHIYKYIYFYGGSVACTACTAASQQEGHGFDSHMGAVGSGGQVLPRVHSGLSPGPFCVEFACSPRVHKGFPPVTTPTEKTCKRTEHFTSVPDQDRRFNSPGPRALKSCPLNLEDP